MNVREHSTTAEAFQADNAIQPSLHAIPIPPDLSRSALYLLLSLPLGIVYFVVLVTGIALGVGLAIVWIGIPILLFMLSVTRSMIDLELRQAERWLGVTSRQQPIPSGGGLIKRLQTVITAPGFWSSLSYLLLKLPLGVLSFTLAISLPSASLALILMPTAYFLSTIFHFTIMGGFWDINSWPRAFLCTLLGLGLAWVSVLVLNGLAEMWRQMVRNMLRPLE